MVLSSGRQCHNLKQRLIFAEMDVPETAEGVIVLLHDTDLVRYLNLKLQ